MINKKNNINIAIIGYGRFGRLLAEIMSDLGQIFIIDKIDIKNNKLKKIAYKDLGEMDIIIPAVPISAFKNVIKKMKPYLGPGTIVMDVCSVKVWPCFWMKKYLPRDIKIIGTHPMFGPDSAKYGLKGLTMVFCPVRIKNSELKNIMYYFRKKKLDVLVMTPENHDKEAAISLSLVHFIGRALGAMKIKPQQVSTLGYDRLLTVNETVENDSLELFYDMHKFNPYAEKERKKYIKSLEKLNSKLNP
jgi:prephenate dehydrogenase